jgi:hypothetical protein
MYLHPLIHTELIRQRQRELSRLPLRGDRGSRSLSGKQAAATIGVLLVATIAALALTSGALAAASKKPARPGTGTEGTGWKVVQDAGGKITIWIGGRIVYVYYPAPAGPQISSNTGANDDCVNYQVNCTDEQNCQYWGVCSRITNQSADAPAANQETSAGDSANDGSGQADNANLEPLTETDAVSDGSAGQAASDTSVNLVDPYTDEDC